VLVVDDFPSNLLVAEGLLAPYGMRVFTCPSGRKAVEMVQARSFDLVFMDHMMPEMDGLEATRTIRALGGRFAELPILALTANVIDGMKTIFLENGFNDLLPKPINTAKLDALLQRWIPAAKQKSGPESGESDPEEAAEMFLPEIEGVDIAAGLAGIGGSPSRYRELLRMFQKDVEAHFARLEANPDQAGLAAFTTVVHALKSGLANVGATVLSGAAAVLEQAGRHGDLAAIGNKLPSFREDLAALMARLDAATSALAGAGGPESGSAPAASAPTALPRETLAGLKAALAARDTDGVDMALARLQKLQLDPPRHMAVAEITKHILFGDFKKALEAVNAWLERG
jgi:CheY-like chemotaxis protein